MMDSDLSILRGPSIQYETERIDKMIEEVVRTKGNNVALMFEEKGQMRKHTFKEFNTLSNRLAHLIHQAIRNNNLRETKDNDYIIGIYMQPSDYMLIAMLAIWKVGAAYLPLDPTYPEDRIRYILSDAQPALIICDKDEGNFPNTFKFSIRKFVDCLENVPENGFMTEQNNLAVVLYTSGSTGTPKGACLSFKSLYNRLQWQFCNYPFSRSETVCVFKTVFTFVDSIFEIWGPLLSGVALLAVPKPVIQNPEKFVKILEEHKIERLILVPSLLSSILMFKEMSGNKDLLKNLKLWISSSEVLSPVLVKRFYTHFTHDEITLANFYGSTEILDVTSFPISNLTQLAKYESFPLGTPIDNTIIYVLDSNLNVVKPGELGEICISGQTLPLKYISKENQIRLKNNPFDEKNTIYSKIYQTDDLGQIKDGILYYFARNDSLVKIRGHRVDLFEVEGVVNSIHGVIKGVVLCYKPGDMNQAVLTFVKTDDSGLADKKTIESELRSRLPSFMIPKVIIVDTIPLLVNGKTDRQTLLKGYEKTHIGKNELDYSGVSPSQLPAAKLLFETIDSFSSGLLKSTISINANFFEIGGNSLNSIFTISKLKQHGYNISINDFITAETLGGIIDKLQPEFNNSSLQASSEYVIEFLKDSYKKDFIDVLTASFYERSNLELWLDGVQKSHYGTLIEKNWTELVNQKLAFVVKEIKTGDIVGVSINYNAKKSFDFHADTPIDKIIDFAIYLENHIRRDLFKKYDKIFYADWIGTAAKLIPQQNVAVIHFIQQQTQKLAKSLEYQGILTANHSPVTQQLAMAYGYETLLEFQVNQYVASDETKPFGEAPDSQTISIDFKLL